MKKSLFILLVFLFLPFLALAQEEKKEAAYFYAEWCSHCQKVNDFFEEKGFYQKYDIKKYNFDEPENKALLSKLLQVKGVQSVGIPAVVVGEEIILGDSPIIADFENKIESASVATSEYVAKFGKGKMEIQKQEIEKKENMIVEGISLSVLIGAALVDAINPCAFAVLIILVATVLNAQGKRKSLYSGLLFSLAIFISYVLMGLGVYRAITVFNLPQIISLVVGIVALVIGLANLKDAFWYGKFFIMEVPVSWRPKMKLILKKITSPAGAFLAGFLVSLFLLPCTSGPYVVVLGLLAEKVAFAKTFALLILYNAIFILPMILITLAVSYFGVKAGKLEDWRQKNLKSLHLVAGIIMTLIGIYLIGTHI